MLSADEILKRLNDEQRVAAVNYEGPSFIVAGPGSGKTYTVISRTQYMIAKGIDPSKIVLFTFTNKAAKEIKERIIKAVGEDLGSEITTGTYHSFCCKLLRMYGNKIGFSKKFSIFDSDDSDKVIKKICEKTNIEPKKLKKYISIQKRNCITTAEAVKNRDDNYALFYKEYQDELKKQNSMDFDDLIFNTIRLLRTHIDVRIQVNSKWQYIVADEFHDSSKSDIQLIRLLAGTKRNVCFILDNDQSIYSFRGADLDSVLMTRQIYDNLKIYNLNQNYRCSKTIVEASKSLIAKNPVDIKKNIFTENPEGNKIFYYEERTNAEEGLRVAKTIKLLKEKYKIKYEDMAVLYRTNKQSRAIEDALIKTMINYEILSGVNFFQRAEIKDILSFLKFITNPFDTVAFERIVNIPKRGIGEVSIGKVIDESRAHIPPINIFEACESVQGLKGKAKKGIKEFFESISHIIEVMDDLTVSEVILEIIKTFNYYTYLEKTYKDDFEDKIDNVMELIDLAHEFLTIEEMLEQTSLDRKNNEDEDQSKVKLMTMHMSKGLEFPVVFMVGMNEGTIPSFNSLDSIKAIEEERRLCYVAMTRAKNMLFLTRPKYTMHNGGGLMKTKESPFVSEINPAFLHHSSVKRK